MLAVGGLELTSRGEVPVDVPGIYLSDLMQCCVKAVRYQKQGGGLSVMFSFTFWPR